MFTGIIQGQGRIAHIHQQGDWVLTIAAPGMDFTTLMLGASVAFNGVCLTVIDIQAPQFKVQMSAETLAKTTARFWREGQTVNLERALRAGDELGGHYVSGHVDGVTVVTARDPDADSVRLRFRMLPEFKRFIAAKGSVVLDGVSLTVNDVTADDFGVNIIPHTQKVTTLGDWKTVDAVNVEVDMIARYVAQMMGIAA